MSVYLASYFALALAYSGMTGLCVAMNRHFTQVIPNTPLYSQVVQGCSRWLGWLLITSTLIPCISYWGISIGSVVWIGFLSLGALLVAWLFAYQPKLATALASIAFISVILLWILY